MQTYECYLTDRTNEVVLREEIGAGDLGEALESPSGIIACAGKAF
jgi:hypothetical protein